MRIILLISMLFLAGCGVENGSGGYIAFPYGETGGYRMERRVRDVEWDQMREEQREGWERLNRANGW